MTERHRAREQEREREMQGAVMEEARGLDTSPLIVLLLLFSSDPPICSALSLFRCLPRFEQIELKLS